LKNLKLPVYFYPLAAMLFWGLSFIWTTILFKYYSPVAIIFIRLILSSSFLFILILILNKREKVDRSDFLWFLFAALFNPFLYFMGENYGLKFSSPTIASIIIATIPVFSPIVAYVSYRERLSLLNIAGILVSFAGVVLMLVTKDFSLAVDKRGIFCLAGAVAASLVYSVLQRKLTFKYSSLTIIAWQNFIGIFYFLPLFIFSGSASCFSVPLNREIVTSFLLLSILASSLSFVFYTKTIQMIGISKSNIFSNLIPVFTGVFSFLLLSESFSLRKIAGMIIVISGVYLSERRRRNPVSNA
jgi:drug/metabolite transporter (DMT)-like permease